METFGQYLDLPSAYPAGGKPRNEGVTMIMDQGWPTDFARGMLEAFGSQVDIVKLWDPHLSQPREVVEEKVRVYREHDVIVQPGGLIIEIAKSAGRGVELVEKLASMGFNAIEVSSTTSMRVDTSEDEAFIKEATKHGMLTYGEVGRKFADGDETRLTERTIDFRTTVAEFKALLEAGAEKVYWEGHLLRQVMGDDPETIEAQAATGTQQVIKVAEEVGIENIMFEVSGLRPRANRQWLQFWLIRVFGPQVNIANARIEEMGNLQALRSGNHPIFGFGSAGNYPWIRAMSDNREDWWR